MCRQGLGTDLQKYFSKKNFERRAALKRTALAQCGTGSSAMAQRAPPGGWPTGTGQGAWAPLAKLQGAWPVLQWPDLTGNRQWQAQWQPGGPGAGLLQPAQPGSRGAVVAHLAAGTFPAARRAQLVWWPQHPPYRPSNIRLGMNGPSRASLREDNVTAHAIERSLRMRTAARTLAVLAGAKMLL